MHVIDFDLGLLVKEELALSVWSGKCFASEDTVFCLATSPRPSPIPRPEHRAVTGADT